MPGDEREEGEHDGGGRHPQQDDRAATGQADSMLATATIQHDDRRRQRAPVQAASAQGTASALFYLLAYTFMVIGSFASGYQR